MPLRRVIFLGFSTMEICIFLDDVDSNVGIHWGRYRSSTVPPITPVHLLLEISLRSTAHVVHWDGVSILETSQ